MTEKSGEAGDAARGPQLFIDLDGVLADFDRFYAQQFGVKLDRNAKDPPGMWDNIEQHGSFYADLPVIPDALELWAGAKRLHPRPIILTGIPHSITDVERHKREWVARYIDPDATVVCCASKDKRLHGKPGDVLIDDWHRYRALWEEMGGVFILHTSAKDSLTRAAAFLPAARGPQVETLAVEFAAWWREHREGSPNAAYRVVDKFVRDVEVALSGGAPAPTAPLTPASAESFGLEPAMQPVVDELRRRMKDGASPAPQEHSDDLSIARSSARSVHGIHAAADRGPLQGEVGTAPAAPQPAEEVCDLECGIRYGAARRRHGRRPLEAAASIAGRLPGGGTAQLSEDWLRAALWLNHGCSDAVLYGDDGEMQCNNMVRHIGPIDFKRQPIHQLVYQVLMLTLEPGGGTGAQPASVVPVEPQDARLRKLVADWRKRAAPPPPDWVGTIPECCREEILGCADELEEEIQGGAPAAQEHSDCICAATEIAVMGTPDPLCPATVHRPAAYRGAAPAAPQHAEDE